MNHHENSIETGLTYHGPERRVSDRRGSAVPIPSKEKESRLIHELKTHQIELETQNEELRRIQLELEKTRDKYTDLYDFAPVGYCTIQKNGTIIDANMPAAELLGVNRGSLIGRNLADYVARGDRDSWHLHQRQVFSTGELKSCELQLMKRDGHSFNARIESATTMDEEKEAAALRSIITDVTEQKKAAEQIRKSRDEWIRTFDSITDFVSVIDNEMRITKANKALADFCNASPKELIGKNCYEVFHGTKEPWKPCPFELMLKKRSTVTQEVNDPAVGMPLLVSLSPIFDEKGEISGAVHIAKDMSEIKKLEQQISKDKNIEALGVLAGGLAHDFNNLLMSIVGNADLAALFIDRRDEALKCLDSVSRGCMQAHELTKQLLTFSRGGAPVKESSTLRDVISDSCKFALSGSKIKCEFVFPEDKWPIDVDKGQISRVLQNLMLNASDAMPDGGEVRVLCENMVLTADDAHLHIDGKRCVRISVSDNGPGIADELKNKIFDPYFSTKEMSDKKGTGLGLAICHSIIVKHGGAISVDSEPGGGATFNIYLPVANFFKVETAVPDTTAAPIIGEGRILIMEDEESVALVLEKILQKIGYETVLAKNGEEALARYRDAMESGNYFDAVVLDLTIKGGMGGRETMENILKIDENAKAIVSSGYANDPVMADYEKHGFKAAIEKPYTAVVLSKILAEVAGGRQTQTPPAGDN